MEVAKMGEKMNAGQRSRRAIAECVVAVLEAMAVLEGAYDLPQNDYHDSGDESASSTRPFILEFEGMSEELMRGMDWTNNELHNALELLSRNLQTLKEFLAGLVSCLSIFLPVFIAICLASPCLSLWRCASNCATLLGWYGHLLGFRIQVQGYAIFQ
jgi:hypothetical protein